MKVLFALILFMEPHSYGANSVRVGVYEKLSMCNEQGWTQKKKNGKTGVWVVNFECIPVNG